MVRPSSAATAAGASSMNERDRTDEAKYRGVRKRKWGKWVSEIRLPNSRERIWLGSYDSPEKAARAFDAALFCLRGNTANFNFPHQPPNIPGGTDLHPSQIQAVAAHYANSYHHSTSSHDDQLQDDHPSDGNSYYENNSSSMDVVSSSSCSFLTDDHHNMNNIPDFGIFPGFDDYFMQLDHQPAYVSDYGEEAVYSQDPTCLWNFK